MVKIYIAGTEELEDAKVFERLLQAIPAHRRARIDKLHAVQDKRLSLGAWLLLQKGLAEQGIDAKKAQIGYAQGGKPYLEKAGGPFFNLSHSKNRVMCAVADQEVGCDVEKIRENDLKVAGRFFQEKEYEAIMNLETQQQRVELFYRLWTLKESFMKATGLGMKLPLNEFAIEIKDEGIVVEQQVDEQEQYFFREYDLADGYQYACCAKTDEFDKEPVYVSLREM